MTHTRCFMAIFPGTPESAGDLTKETYWNNQCIFISRMSFLPLNL